MVLVAKSRGFEVRLIYILVRNVDIQIDRVATRVQEGGHDVPQTKIRERRTRSFQQLPWFLEHVDDAYVFDNSTGEPELLIEKVKGSDPFWHRKLPKDLKQAFSDAGIPMGRLA